MLGYVVPEAVSGYKPQPLTVEWPAGTSGGCSRCAGNREVYEKEEEQSGRAEQEDRMV